ncbi:MAG: Snf7 family protein [Candidatus Ranarchaeia archaeon]
MGIFSRLRRWLNPTLSVKDLSLKLQTLVEMLDIQAEELDAKSGDSRYQAKVHLQKKQREQARFYTKMYLQYVSWAQQLLQYKANLEGLNIRLQQGENLRQVVTVMSMVQKNLANMKTDLPSMPQLARQADELTRTINHLQIASRVTDKTLNPALVPIEVRDSVVDETLLQLEEEAGAREFPTPLGPQILDAKERLRDLGE